MRNEEEEEDEETKKGDESENRMLKVIAHRDAGWSIFFILPQAICLGRERDRIFSWWHSAEIADSWLFSLWPRRLCEYDSMYTAISADIDRMCKWFWPYSEISYQFSKHHCIPCQMPEVSVKDIMMLSCALGKLHDASPSPLSPFPFSTLNVCQPKSGGMKHLARISTFQNFIKPKLTTVN